MAIGLLIAAAGARAMVALPAWRTGAHVVTQRGPDGVLLLDIDCTEAVDIRARMIVYEGAAWTWCKGSAFPHGALTRIDAGAGEARVRWPLPAGLPFGDATEGVFPGPDGALGIVFRIREVNGRLALAVAGENGWVHPPTALPGDASSRLLGGAWVGSALEVVVIATEDGIEDLVHAAPVIVRAEAGSLRERRPFADVDALCPTERCFDGAEAAHHREGAWRIAIAADAEELDVWWVAENGDARPSGWGKRVALAIRDNVDFADAGLTYRPVLDRIAVRHDGSLVPAPQPPGAAWGEDAAWADFDVLDGRLRRRASWVAEGPVLHRGQQVSERFFATNSTYQIDPPILSLTEIAADGTETATPIAHDPGFECGGSLSVGTIVEQPDGGWALVSDTGCYVLLDAELRRLDPLPLSEHLLRRGSLGRWDEGVHAMKLAWVLLGLPVCVGLALLAGTRRRRRTPTPLATAAAIGAVVYVVTGGACLAMVLPLLT